MITPNTLNVLWPISSHIFSHITFKFLNFHRKNEAKNYQFNHFNNLIIDTPQQKLYTWILSLIRSLPTLYPFHNHQQNVNISLGLGPREWNTIHVGTPFPLPQMCCTHTHTHMCKQGFFREKKKLKIFAYKLPGEQKRETAKTRQANPKWGRRGLRTHAGLSNRSDWCTYICIIHKPTLISPIFNFPHFRSL